MSTKRERILMTGASGFIGSWILARLAERDIAIDASDIGEDYALLNLLRRDPPPARIAFHTCDIRDAASLDALVAGTRPSTILHLAALQIPQCTADPALGAAVNVGGLINVFEAARKHGVGRVIYTSSIAAKPRGRANAPGNLYGVYKRAGEEIARIYWQDHGVPSLGLRPYIVYGVGRDDGETSAITRAIEAAAIGRPYEVPFTTRSCFQYAGDVADIFARAALAEWEGALVSDMTDNVRSTDDLLAAIRTVVPEAQVTAAPSVRVSPAAGFDTTVLAGVIGAWSEVPLEEGVRRTVDLYRSIDARQTA